MNQYKPQEAMEWGLTTAVLVEFVRNLPQGVLLPNYEVARLLGWRQPMLRRAVRKAEALGMIKAVVTFDKEKKAKTTAWHYIA